MKIDLRFAEIHAPLFLMGDKGVNLGSKLDPAKRKGLVLTYDREAAELLVSYQDMNAIVPVTNVVSMLEASGNSGKLDLDVVRRAQKADTPIVVTTQVAKPIEAQVSTPQSHVFAGPGAGQTGQDQFKAPVEPSPTLAEIQMIAHEAALTQPVPIKRGRGRPPKVRT